MTAYCDRAGPGVTMSRPSMISIPMARWRARVS
jgi:hypothetical protein